MAKLPGELVPVDPSTWPTNCYDPKRVRVFQSRFFLVQEFRERDDVIRISVNLTTVDERLDWEDGIGWEDLQTIKDELGYAERDAVEVFPAQGDLVNVANMRHLWVLPYRLPFIWRESDE